ncbi:MAG: hypothetical protein PUC63_01695 [Clostridiales bacterium]|nr:hypothetical protein [Clostridiales bacterium]
MENGAKGEPKANPKRREPAAKRRSGCVDAFELLIKELVRRTVSKKFSRQSVDTICKGADCVGRIIGNALSLRDEIPATGHQWDEGRITKEPTKYSEGEKTFTCTVCNTTYTETVKAGDTVSEPADDSNPTDNSTGTVSAGESEASGESESSGTERSSSFPRWIIFILIIETGIGVTVFIVNRKKKQSVKN